MQQLIKYSKRLFCLCAKKQSLNFSFIIVLTIFQSFLPVISLISLQNLINSITTSSRQVSIQLLIIYCIILLIGKGTATLVNYLKKKFSLYTIQRINIMIMNKSIELNLSDLENSQTYDLINRAYKETSRPGEMLFQLISIISHIFTFMSYLTILISWKMYLLPILTITPILSFLLAINLGKKEYEILQQRTAEYRKVNYISSIIINSSSYKENTILNIKKYLNNLYKNKYTNFLYKDISIINVKTVWQLIIKIIETFIGCFIIFLIISNSLHGYVMIGNIYSYITAIWGLISSSEGISGTIATIKKNSLYLSNLFSFLDMTLEKINNDEKIKIESVETIEFIHVFYKYRPDLPYVLKDISFKIKSNEKIALLGKNGSGKSTIMKLISGFYMNFEGKILVNNIPLQNIDINSYQKQISAIYQDFTRYEFTLLENLKLAEINTNSREMYDKIKEMNKFGILNYIDKLPNNIDTPLGNRFDNGIQLSGGEWQQLAIGRALVKEASLFIYDEPCSSLDLKSEKSVYNYLKIKSINKICILVSHRIHNIIQFADRVIIFDRACIVEEGDISTLLKKDSLFRNNFYDIEQVDIEQVM